jgi:hypothetical protein
MNNTKERNTIVDSAWDIIEMERKLRNTMARIRELENIEQKYYDLLTENIKHNDKMMANLLMATLAKSEGA